MLALVGCAATAESSPVPPREVGASLEFEAQIASVGFVPINEVLRDHDGAYYCVLRRSDDLAQLRASANAPASGGPTEIGSSSLVTPTTRPPAATDVVRSDDGSYVGLLERDDDLAALRRG